MIFLLFLKYTIESWFGLVSDSYGTFTINFPHQGAVSLVRSLDYEKGGGSLLIGRRNL